jgi:Molecular chaperone
MPSVKTIIEEIADDSGADLYDSDPLTSVAKGAARLAEIKRLGGLVVTNKVAKSIGVRVVNEKNTDAYHKVIVRGEDRPVTRQVELATSIDLQDIIEIEIREGDNDISATGNTLLAKLNAVIRPESKGNIKIKLQIALNDSGALEAYIEPISDKSTVREIKAEGIRLEKGQKETATGELRTEDPVSEFKTQAIENEVDPDTARQIYERLKVKYHPDRQPDKREYWNNKLRELDEYFNEYMLEIEKRMHASSVPNLPWGKPSELSKIIVDEVIANRLTHCLANNIGTAEQIQLMPAMLKQFPDYRRVVASYLFGVKRNPVLQKLLSEDDRPQVGLVVLLQNVQGKSIKERHEVLKAVYRVKEGKIREFIKDENLDINKLYEEVPKVAEVAKNPITGNTSTGGNTANFKGKLNYEYRGSDTIITGNTYPVKELIKNAGGRWDPGSSAWKITGKHVTDNEIFG